MTAATFALPGRSREAELMDAAGTDYATFRACLVDLERVNRASLGYRPTLAWLDRIAGARRRLRVLDVGCGHGDMLRRVRLWARRRGIVAELAGVDLNPLAARAARAATPADMDIHYETADVFALDPGREVDVVLSALFAHHLSDADLPRFVRWMEATARVGWFVNDLHRHPLADRGLRALFAALPVHGFVRHDGPVSVRRGFTRADLGRLLVAAGVGPDRAEIRWSFPFRWGMGSLPR